MQECEPVELKRGAEPDELDGGLVDGVPEFIEELLTARRIRSVCGNDQIVVAGGRKTGYVDLL